MHLSSTNVATVDLTSRLPTISGRGNDPSLVNLYESNEYRRQFNVKKDVQLRYRSYANSKCRSKDNVRSTSMPRAKKTVSRVLCKCSLYFLFLSMLRESHNSYMYLATIKLTVSTQKQ